MATLENGINGGFTGKVGSVIGYQRYGKWIIRALPKPSKKNKTGTGKQNKCRSKFTFMQSFLSDVLEFIRVGFNLDAKAKGMSAHNAAKSYNMLHAFGEDDQIDYAKIRLSQGNLLMAKDASVTVNKDGISFIWDKQLDTGYIRSTDQVMLMAYDEEKGFAVYTVSGNRRKSGEELLIIPLHRKGKSYHTWIAFIADDRQSISDSSYLGLVEY
ncbi:hypothetical protein ASE92_01985 [Pedobacter sp. Leaf41]|uniref:DUF6266 family protein n=1 Tax=Pedobacter sp. Leaf41 TaxID=1736218 RepID=UPI000703AD54|nr:DUF6266 family protein [Pedobacter sp. Leaf41]KQN38229.1 hypothetical protein ASE92_01985 [Pedobacter sp. Leaf41]RZL60200.1 MAG: hypothetical protein EOO93_15100 [Pedobacter sp.]